MLVQNLGLLATYLSLKYGPIYSLLHLAMYNIDNKKKNRLNFYNSFSVQDEIESVSPEAVKKKEFSTLKSQIPRKRAKLPEPTLVPWLKKGPDAKKSGDDSSPKFFPKAPYKDLFERIKQNAQATAFTTEMNMESLNIYYRCVILVYFISFI